MTQKDFLKWLKEQTFLYRYRKTLIGPFVTASFKVKSIKSLYSMGSQNYDILEVVCMDDLIRDVFIQKGLYKNLKAISKEQLYYTRERDDGDYDTFTVKAFEIGELALNCL